MKKGLLTRFFLSAAICTACFTNDVYTADALESAKDHQIIDTICQSKAPILIIDNFSLKKPDYGQKAEKPLVDIDGDNIPDIEHGDLIEKIVRLSGKNTITYGLGNYKTLKAIDIIGGLSNIIDLINNKEMEPPAAISISIGLHLTLTDIEWVFGRNLALTPKNITDKKEAIISSIEKMWQKDKHRNNVINNLHSYHELFSKLREMGVPVITTAGNDFSENTINLFAVLGALSVGALTHDGSEIAPYSNQNSLTKIYRIGDFISRKVDGGIDINNDGQADFTIESMSNGKTIIKKFNGTLAKEERKSSIYDYKKLLEFYYDLSGNDVQNAKNAARVYGEFIHYASHTPFRKTAAGNLMFDPANDGDKTQVKINKGTSFAAPNICGK